LYKITQLHTHNH